MIYGYARVSSLDQNLDRQIKMLSDYVSDQRYIITDKQSGKTFDRKGYNSLCGTSETIPILHEGDLLVICSLDRLGRNYSEIREQWNRLTNVLKVNIKVLDMPLLDTENTNENLDGKFIADLTLQILSYVSEKERISIRARQRQGIDIALNNGVKFGRPAAEYPVNWESVYQQWKNKNITATKAMEILQLKRTTFYKLAKACEHNK